MLLLRLSPVRQIRSASSTSQVWIYNRREREEKTFVYISFHIESTSNSQQRPPNNFISIFISLSTFWCHFHFIHFIHSPFFGISCVFILWIYLFGWNVVRSHSDYHYRERSQNLAEGMKSKIQRRMSQVIIIIIFQRFFFSFRSSSSSISRCPPSNYERDLKHVSVEICHKRNWIDSNGCWFHHYYIGNCI